MVIKSVGEMEVIIVTSSKVGFNIKSQVSKLLEKQEQKWGERSPVSLSNPRGTSMPLSPEDVHLPCLPTQSLRQASGAAPREPTAASTLLQEVVLLDQCPVSLSWSRKRNPPICLPHTQGPPVGRTKLQPPGRGI